MLYKLCIRRLLQLENLMISNSRMLISEEFDCEELRMGIPFFPSRLEVVIVYVLLESRSTYSTQFFIKLSQVEVLSQALHEIWNELNTIALRLLYLCVHPRKKLALMIVAIPGKNHKRNCPNLFFLLHSESALHLVPWT